MPFSLTAVPAALVEEGQDVLIGDIRVLAGTRVAIIDGLTTGVFGDAPPSTLFGNLFTETGPMRPFGMNMFIGSGLAYTNSLANGPFPEVVVENAQAFPTSSTTMVVPLPTPLLRDRYIVETQHNGVNTVTTPSGWTLVSHAALADSDVNVYERIVDQTFIDNHDYSVKFVASVAGATLAKVNLVRYAHISLASEAVQQTNTSTGGTSNDLPALTPSWGNANTLWLTFIGIEADDTSPPNVTAFPTTFISTGELQNASATTSLDGAIAWGQLSSRTTSVDPSAYTYAASRSAAFLIAIPPRVTGAISATGGLAAIATDTFLGNVSGSTAVPVAVALSTLAGAGLVFGTHTLDVTAGAGASLVVSANDIQRGALTGAITASQDSNATAFGVLAAKSVLANATNASAIPAALAGSAAFQHLRVNSGNTGLEWSLFTSGDFPAAVVPLTALATQAAHTFVANNTAGVASPTAISATAATAELDLFTSTLKGLVPLSGGGTVNFLRADGTFAAPPGTGAGTGLQFVTYGAEATLSNERVTTASTTIAIDVSVASQIAFTLGALTGAVTTSANSLTTAFGALAAKSVLANATNASAVPAALAGSAAFQHLRVNSGNTGLEWSVFTTGDFPAASVPITAIATIATDTFLANVTAGTATPTAVNISTLAGAGLVFGTHTLDVTAGAGASLVVTANDIQRGALTGAVTASQDSNTTAFGTLAAKSVLANATNASAVPAALAGSAAFQHLRVNSANTALEWSVFTSGDFPAGTVPLTGMATQAAHTFVANNTAGVASPTAISATAATAELDLFTSTLKGLTPLSGGGTVNFLRADGTWTAPTATLAAQAANTVLANATAGVAVPTAVAVGAESVFGQTSGNLQGIASAVQTALIRGSGSVFWGAAAADQVLRRSGSGDLGFGTLVTNNIGNNQVTLGLLAQVATAKLLGRTTAATGNVEALTLVNSTTNTWNVATGGSISVERAALTGLVTAAANSNVTTIANNAVTNAMLAVATAQTLKGNITGSVAVPTDNNLSDTLDALAGVSERLMLARDVTGWGAHAQSQVYTYLNLPSGDASGCIVTWIDEDFQSLVATAGTTAFIDAFVAITGGSVSSWSLGGETAGYTASIAPVAVANGHNGIVRISTDTTNTHDAILFITSNIRFDRVALADFWVKLGANTTELVQVGFMQGPGSTSGGTDSCFFQFNPATNANFQTISRLASGVATTTTTSVAPSTTWHKLSIWTESSVSIKFYIDNTLVATHTTGIPTTVFLSPDIYIKTLAAVARTIDVDRVRIFAKDITLLT